MVQHTELEIRRRIGQLVESVEHDQARSQELFHYVWTMMCVRRGLLRLVREESTHGRDRLVLEEVRTGRERIVTRPDGLDREIEGLAIEALARIMGVMKVAS